MAIIQAGKQFTKEDLQRTAGDIASFITDHVQSGMDLKSQLESWTVQDMLDLGLTQAQVDAIRGFYMGDLPPIQAALFWIILFFAAATGLPRAFVREEETGTAIALRKTLPGALVLAGKALFNFALFFAIAAVVVVRLMAWPRSFVPLSRMVTPGMPTSPVLACEPSSLTSS